MNVCIKKLGARLADIENMVNDARKVEGLKRDKIDPVQMVNDIFDIETSILLEADEVLPTLQTAASALAQSQGLENLLAKVDGNLAEKVKKVKEELLVKFSEKYNIDQKDLLED